MSKKLCIFITSLIISMSCFANVSTIEWLDLIPLEERELFLEERNGLNIDHAGPASAQSSVGTMRSDMHGKKVSISGFVIPLEGSESKVTEFLLVPYFGACIHVPPPPPNQIIYVKYDLGADMRKLWELVTVSGEIKIETQETGLAETGYTLYADEVDEYKE